jgi:lysozyme family protein
MTSDYAALYEEALVLGCDAPYLSSRCQRIIANKASYDLVSLHTEVPWWLVGILHSLEAGCSFQRHFLNGDPLTHRTIHAPAGRPMAPPGAGAGQPYQWYETAVDALNSRIKPPVWTLALSLDFMERYNGLGYAQRGLLSPYLWACTSLYKGGLFVADGVYNPHAWSGNLGGAALLKVLQSGGVVTGL